MAIYVDCPKFEFCPSSAPKLVATEAQIRSAIFYSQRRLEAVNGAAAALGFPRAGELVPPVALDAKWQPNLQQYHSLERAVINFGIWDYDCGYRIGGKIRDSRTGSLFCLEQITQQKKRIPIAYCLRIFHLGGGIRALLPIGSKDYLFDCFTISDLVTVGTVLRDQILEAA